MFCGTNKFNDATGVAISVTLTPLPGHPGLLSPRNWDVCEQSYFSVTLGEAHGDDRKPDGCVHVLSLTAAH